MKHNYKRFLAMVMAVVMIIGMMPLNVFAAEETTTVYLKPNSSIWATDGAWFAAYYWDGNGSNWAKLTDEDNDGYYEAEIPAGYSNIIFTRNDPAKTDLSWDSKWNQTGDLIIEGNNNCFTITGWDNGAGVGTWSHKCIPGAAATCTTAQTCTVCGDELGEALGHTAGAAATCTTAQTCTVCGDELAAALGHNYVDGVCTVCEADEPWYDADATEYHIANKDELIAFAEAVDNGDTFAGKTVYLDADIDLYEMDENGERVTFNPIGTNSSAVFEGTFDGQNHTIKNLYQNGWALGYEWGTYGSVGLFASVNNATVKNLTIEGTECLVEGGDVSAITGSATGTCVFENITVKDSVIATYNNGCGSIIAWSGAGNYTFKDITIESDVTLAGLWGSFDSSIGGVVGQGEPGATYNFENVDIACRIDAYNDCTASYDYYNYRMCGMIIGRLEETTTIDGRNYPDTTKYNITCTDVTVTYGDWMNYHYCDPTPGHNNGRGMRVETGYAYDALPADYDHSQCTTNHYNLLPFNQLFGGDQYGVKGLPTYEGVTVKYPQVAAIGETTYASIADAVAAAQDGDTITVVADHEIQATVVIDKDVTLDLNSKAVGVNGDIIPAIRVLADVTVTGDGMIDGDTYADSYAFIVGNSDTEGSLTIVDGSYYGDTTVASVTQGTLNIEGGYFEASPYITYNEDGTVAADYGYRYTLNCIDANYEAGTAKINVTGGTFYGFDPADNLAEGEGTNFVAEGYVSNENLAVTEGREPTWTVTKAPEPVYVAEVVETGVKYESLQEALNACTNGETVKLLDNIFYQQEDAVPAHGGGTGFGKYDAYNPAIVYLGGTKGATDAENQPSNVNAVLDMNGHVIYNSADAYMFLIMDNAKLTFTDSVGAGQFTNTTKAPVIWAVGTDTLVTIEGGRYGTRNTEGLIWATHGADLVITGGEFMGVAQEDSLLIVRNSQDRGNPNYFVDGKATVTVTGGTYLGFDPEAMLDDSTDPFTQFNAVPFGYESVKDEEKNTWTVTEVTDFYIYTKEDLVNFAALVDNAGDNSFAGKTAHLMADIDLYEVDENGERVTFNPIGNNSAAVFDGTFDGHGHTISNMYQSGWALGYEWGKAGYMGLFSYVYNGTVKNLTIENAETFVEGGITAGIAGCAYGECTFENINIVNSKIATYNSRAAGIVGWAGKGDYTFKNISVDDQTVIAGLWGSFDSTLGGVVGELVADSTASFEDVTVDCRLDAYNDCTASYDYYNYRMCGMIIGRLKETTTIDGRNYPDMTKYNITCTDVTVNYGTWMNYHYCEPTPGHNNGRGMRVEVGYAYDGLPADYDHSQCTTNHNTLIPFDQIFGGDQLGVDGLAAYEGVTVNYPDVAAIGETPYDSIAEAVAAAQDGDTITVLVDHEVHATVVIDKDVTLDLNGKTVKGCGDIIPVIRVLADVTVTGDGTIDGATNSDSYAFIVGNSETAGNLTIESGSYYGDTTVASVTKGTLNIEDGYFEASPYITYNEDGTVAVDYGYRYTLNCIDANYADGSAVISVTGGTFYGFDPEANAAEGENTNFCAEGYLSDDNGNDTWTVRAAKYVAENVETGEKYESLQEAMNDCANGGTVRLIADIEVDGSDITSVPAATNSNGKYFNPGIFNLVGDVAVTVDLNGHNITYHGHGVAPYTATANKNYYYNEETGAYEVNSCTIAHGLFLTNDGADLTIVDNAGTAAINVYGLASAAYSCSPGSTITIEGGTWNNMGCETCGGTNIFLYASHGGELYIEGGYFAQDLDADGNSYLIVEHGGAYANSVIDYSVSKIEITGGTFAGMNPELAHYFEQTAGNKLVTGATTNVVAEGYYAKDNGDNSWTVLPKPVAKVEVEIMPGVWASTEITKGNWADLVSALGENTNLPVKVTLYEDIELAETLIISGNKTVDLNLNGKTITVSEGMNATPAIRVLADVTVHGGTVDATNGTSTYAFIVGNSTTEGKLTITDGTYKGITTAVSVTKGQLNVSGGYFKATEYDGAHEFTLNCIDANYNDGSAVISLTGGTYYGFDPENNAAEGEGTNFCAQHYVSVDNGDGTWTVMSAVEAGYVCWNVQTGVYYEKVTAGLQAAENGQTVQLLTSTSDGNVLVFPGLTLDLNGFDLTADYLVGFNTANVIDSQNGTGSLITGIEDVVLDEENAMVPVYNGSAYLLTKVGFALRQDADSTDDCFEIDAMAYPVVMEVVELLKNGGADNNIRIAIRLSWDSAKGESYQEFVFTDDVVAAVYGSNNGTFTGYTQRFSMEITGFEGIQNLKARMVILSDTNATYISSNSVDIT